MKLIVGLGNPDKEHQNSRHNLGKNIIINFMKTLFKEPLINKTNLLAQIYETGQGSDKTIFAIPTEYMNNSGLTIQKISNFYRIIPQDIYVIHDDLDLPTGEYKIQFDRGPAGHNGIKSIIENLGTQQFNRIRIGIDKPRTNIPIEDYVLQPLSKKEQEDVDLIIPKIIEGIKKLCNQAGP